MATVYESFSQGYKVPGVNYGNVVYENSDVLIYVDITNDERTTTIFTMTQGHELIKKSITSKTVRVFEIDEEIIREPRTNSVM